MKFVIQPAEPSDEPFLWRMLYEAAHMAEAGESIEVARQNPALARYVAGWGKEHDTGVIAVVSDTGERAGAAWFRLLAGDMKGYGHVSDQVPELSIATTPELRGCGAGTALMEALVRRARGVYPALSLSVRDGNPAARLYERFGFRRAPCSDVTNRVGSTSFTMVLDLA